MQRPAEAGGSRDVFRARQHLHSCCVQARSADSTLGFLAARDVVVFCLLDVSFEKAECLLKHVRSLVPSSPQAPSGSFVFNPQREPE